ncbi:MAG: GNAT family N-acetyltransferase [Clostridiales bacterium]|nr:GNAT family N-acetyltransferase [Clostridiales bacterium]
MISLRPATNKDRYILSDTCISIAPLYDKFMPNAFNKQAERFLKQGLSQSYDTFIIENDKEAIGFIGTKKLNEQIVYLVACYMHSEYQNKGFGSLVMDNLRNVLNESDMKEIVLLVHKKAIWAQKFYLKNRFVTVSDDKDKILLYGDGIFRNDYLKDTVLMTYKMES